MYISNYLRNGIIFEKYKGRDFTPALMFSQRNNPYCELLSHIQYNKFTNKKSRKLLKSQKNSNGSLICKSSSFLIFVIFGQYISVKDLHSFKLLVCEIYNTDFTHFRHKRFYSFTVNFQILFT